MRIAAYMKPLLHLATLFAAAGLAQVSRAASAPEAVCSLSTTVFCSGFEEGSFSIWDDYDGNPGPWNALIQDSGPRNVSGNTVSQLRVPAGRGGTDLVKLFPSGENVVYVRWYQKWEAGYDFSAQNHGGGIHAGDRNLMGRSGYRPNGSDWYSAWLEPRDGRLTFYLYYPGMYQDCTSSNGSCYGDHIPCFVGSSYCTRPEHVPATLPPVMQADRWYCLEMMVDAGTPTPSQSGANGAVNFWIDGKEYGPWNQLWFRTTTNLKTSILSLSLFHHGTHSTAGVRQDDVVVSRTRVGCTSDQLRPAPPRDLRVD